MKIATFNINSIRNRLPRLLEWLDEAKPDVVCLQELRVYHEEFPVDAIRDAGYGALWQGQKPRYNGVAILARSSGSIGAFCPRAIPPVGILPQIGVSMMPGCTELTRTPSPNEAHSIAIAFANNRTPPFVAQ